MAKSLQDSLKAMKAAETSEQLEEALSDVTSSSARDTMTTSQFVDQLTTILADGSLLNAKLRRKVKRLQEIISAPLVAPGTKNDVASTSTSPRAKCAIEEAPAAQLDTTEPASSVEKSLASIIDTVRTSKSALELETAVADVRPGVGTCHSRRSLKRAIDAVMKLGEIEGSMNARIRRRMARVLKIVGPGGAIDTPPALTIDGARDQKRKLAKGKNEDCDSEEGARKKKRKVVPYVVFVGQLPFDISEVDLESHFVKSASPSGPIKVRLLTDSASKNPKGMAFVEASSAEDMYSLLALHHTALRGRRINVELSCGGKDPTKRAEKLQGKRVEQASKLREKSALVLEESERQGVIEQTRLGESFKDKLLNCHPQALSHALKSYEKIKPEDRTFALLDSLISKVN